MQDLFAILIALAAAGYLIRAGWQKMARSRSGACGSCAGCGAADSLKPRPLVILNMEMRKSHAKVESRKG
jgi:hypothetical protein